MRHSCLIKFKFLTLEILSIVATNIVRELGYKSNHFEWVSITSEFILLQKWACIIDVHSCQRLHEPIATKGEVGRLERNFDLLTDVHHMFSPIVLVPVYPCLVTKRILCDIFFIWEGLIVHAHSCIAPFL